MKKRTLIIIILLALVGGATAFYVFSKKEEKRIMLQTAKAQAGYISESVTATGTIEPVDTVAVGTQVSGVIQKVYADFNSNVKKGQLLAQLDKSLLTATLNQAKATLSQAQSQLIYQQANYSRQEQLYKVGAISKADYDNALYQYQAAKASVNNAQAQVQSAERNLSYADIYSPIDGVVLSRNISVGQTVAASFSTPTLFVIAKDITKMQVQADVDEADIGNVQDSQRATFTVDAFLNDVFNGTVQEIRLDPTTSSNVVTYKTLVNAPNDNKKLKPGMTANITIFTKEANDALLVPAKALKFQPDASLSKQYVVVPVRATTAELANKSVAEKSGVDSLPNMATVWVLEGNKLIEKRIKTGLNDDTNVQVLEGLSSNEVVVTGSSSLTSSQPQEQGESSPFMPKPPSRNNSKPGAAQK